MIAVNLANMNEDCDVVNTNLLVDQHFAVTDTAPRCDANYSYRLLIAMLLCVLLYGVSDVLR